MAEVHSVCFDKKNWSTDDARYWLATHGYKRIKKVDKTINQLRYRIKDPALYSKFVTKKLPNGINLVFGFR